MKNNTGKTRGQRIWDNLRDLRDTAEVSLNRAWLVTQAYRETEGQPKILRRARAHEKVLLNLPIHIDDEQLLVGDFASEPMGFEWWPELPVRWVGEALDNGWFTYRIPEEKFPQVREIVEYWKDRESKQSFLDYISGIDKDFYDRLCTMNEKGSLTFFAETEASLEKGWHVPNYEKVINIGMRGIIREIEAELKKTPIIDNQSYEKVNLLSAMKTAMESGIKFAKRYSALAAEMAEREADSVRKQELLRIADTCGWILENPCRDFRDAIQAMFLTHIIIFFDVRCSGISFGRVDQYLYPYYKADIEAGRLRGARPLS